MQDLTLAPDTRLTPELVELVARHRMRVTLDGRARAGVTHTRHLVEQVLDDEAPHYGINTGFGSLSKQRIERADLRSLQVNLIRSHAAGAGDPLPDDIVRAMMLTLAVSLARGRSGVRPAIIDQLLALLNHHVTPIVPESGSVGASGDLAPLAHLTLVLMGEGEARVNGDRLPGAEALRLAGVEPITLEAKEGLALINGTHLMAGRFALIARDLLRVLDAALLACAMSMDAARTSHAFLDPRVYTARNQPGASRVAASVLRALLDGSTIVTSHARATRVSRTPTRSAPLRSCSGPCSTPSTRRWRASTTSSGPSPTTPSSSRTIRAGPTSSARGVSTACPSPCPWTRSRPRSPTSAVSPNAACTTSSRPSTPSRTSARS